MPSVKCERCQLIGLFENEDADACSVTFDFERWRAACRTPGLMSPLLCEHMCRALAVDQGKTRRKKWA